MQIASTFPFTSFNIDKASFYYWSFAFTQMTHMKAAFFLTEIKSDKLKAIIKINEITSNWEQLFNLIISNSKYFRIFFFFSGFQLRIHSDFN